MNPTSARPLLLAMGGGDWDLSTIAFHLTVITVAGGLVWLAVSQITRLRSNWQRHSKSPAALFAELCQAHAMSRSDRRLLADASEGVAADDCCRVFIDAGIIQQFAQAHPDDAEDCRTLQHRLFGRAE